MNRTASSAAADRYLTERVMTASPAELTAMLFDACVGAMRTAIRLQEAGERAGAGPRLSKAQEILLELRSTLNHEAAGEMSARLDALYTYAFGRLLEGLRGDTAAVREALSVIEPLQEAWRESCLRLAA